MKQIFRHLMGEYNGEILKALCYYHNIAMDELIDIFYYWATVQWLPPGKGTSEATEILERDAVGIAHTAGMFSPVVRSTFMSGSVRFAGDSEVSGADSEQSVQAFIDGAIRYIANLEGNDISHFAGGFDKSSETSGGVKTQTFTGSNDATQVGMVPDNASVIGYLVPAETVGTTGDTLSLTPNPDDTITGQVVMVETEPESGFYLPYYGPEYAWLDKAVLVQVLLEKHLELFMQLFECLQHIRYNGSGLDDFFDLTQALMGDYLKIVSITQVDGKPYAFEVSYTVFDDDETIPVTERNMRQSCWEYFLEKKYPQFVLKHPGVPHLDCILTFENNEASLECTVQPTATIYYTVDGTDPRNSDNTRYVYTEPVYISEITEFKAYAQGADFGGNYYASSRLVSEVLVPSTLYYDGTITYNGDNTYRG